jgi:uncharacterized alpha-E superfamily protein
MMLSRVADCLYWMSRYLERAEHTARAIDVQLNLALDEAPWSASIGWVCLLNSLRTDLPMDIYVDARAATNALAFDRNNPSSIASCIANARENARQIRESVTSDMWEEINRLYLSIRDMNIDRLWDAGPHAFLRSVQRGAQMFCGVADSTMNHGEGWQFIRLGRFLERAMSLAWLLEAHFGMKGTVTSLEPSPDDFVAWAGLLRMCSAFEPYCRMHTVELRPQWILQFLLLDAEFPHSVRFAARQVEESVCALADWTGAPRTAAVQRLAGKLAAQLSYATIDEVLSADLTDYFQGIVGCCAEIHHALYCQYISYTVDAALRGETVGA